MNNLNYFYNKTVVISGAGSGIGRQLAIDLACPNINLVLIDVNESALNKTADELRSKKSNFVLIPCDVASFDQVQKIPSLLPDEFSKIDVVICNAGITNTTTVEDFDYSTNRKVMDVNYFGTVNLCCIFLRDMITRQSGHIVAVSSLLGLRGVTESACYGASKAAVMVFLESLRCDLHKYNIDTTTMVLGFVDTPMNDFIRGKYDTSSMISAQKASSCILKAISKKQKVCCIPFAVKVVKILTKLLPVKLVDAFIIRQPYLKDSK